MPHPRWLALFMLTCLLGVAVGETCYRLVGCFSLTSCRAKDIDDGAYDAATAAMFGTSVTHHALHTVPLLYGATANLTTVGATTLAGDLAMLERMVERNIPLRTVFILAIPEIFGSLLTANDERRRIYFTHVFHRASEVALFARLSGRPAADVTTSVLRRALESRRAFMADAVNIWRLFQDRRHNHGPAAIPAAEPAAEPASGPAPLVADEGQMARAAARLAQIGDLELPNESNRAVLREIEALCEARGMQCAVVLEPIQASVHAALAGSGRLAAIRAAAAGMCWIDLNGVGRWPNGAFEDDVHLSAGNWTRYYRALLLRLLVDTDTRWRTTVGSDCPLETFLLGHSGAPVFLDKGGAVVAMVAMTDGRTVAAAQAATDPMLENATVTSAAGGRHPSRRWCRLVPGLSRQI